MKRVAVLGGGPAGAFTAERLAGAGLHTVILDEKLAWEKPCGGGLTYKAYHRYPFLIDNETPKRQVREARIAAPRAGSYTMRLSEPLLIYSRRELNQTLLNRAEQAGAQLEKTRVTRVERSGRGWRIQTKLGVMEADYAVIATGARNPFKEFGAKRTAHDTMYALGYYVPSEQPHVDIQFLEKLEGYIWVFPRCGHLSVGICGKGEPAQALRARLEAYMAEHELPIRGATFYGHVIPALEPSSWKRNRLAGDGWMAVGDAGGLVDPITGEGLYYAVRSADLAAEVILEDRRGAGELATAYTERVQQDFGRDLAFGSSLSDRVYRGKFLCGGVPARMVQFMRRSPKFLDLMQDMFAGTQPYLSLRDRLLGNLHGTMRELVASFFVEHVLPNHGRV